MERVDDALDELLRPIRHLGLPWAENMTEVLRKHLNQNLQVGAMESTMYCRRK